MKKYIALFLVLLQILVLPVYAGAVDANLLANGDFNEQRMLLSGGDGLLSSRSGSPCRLYRPVLFQPHIQKENRDITESISDLWKKLI